MTGIDCKIKHEEYFHKLHKACPECGVELIEKKWQKRIVDELENVNIPENIIDIVRERLK